MQEVRAFIDASTKAPDLRVEAVLKCKNSLQSYSKTRFAALEELWRNCEVKYIFLEIRTNFRVKKLYSFLFFGVEKFVFLSDP